MMEFIALPSKARMQLLLSLHHMIEDENHTCINIDSNSSPLACAVHIGDEERVVQLLDQGAEILEPVSVTNGNDPPVILAIKCLRFKILLILLRYCSRTTCSIRHSKMSFPTVVCKPDNLNILHLLLCYCRDGQFRERLKQHLMFWAIKVRDFEAVKDLLRLQCELNTLFDDQTTLLHVAATSGEPRIIRVLVENGADVNALDSDKETSLFPAVRINDSASTAMLICLGADVNTWNSKWQTPLHIAAASVHFSHGVVDSLLTNGAVLDWQDSEGNTPLALNLANFILHPTFPITKRLVQHGTLPLSQNEVGALVWAITTTHDVHLLTFLERAGLRRRCRENCAATFALHGLDLLVQKWRIAQGGQNFRRNVTSLYENCIAMIRVHLMERSNGRSILARIKTLPVPELICQELMLEDRC